MNAGSSENRSGIDLKAVEGLVVELLGVQRATLSKLPGFAGNLTVLVRSDGNCWVLKCCSREELEAERVAIGLAAGQGVPVPETVVMDAEPDLFPSPFILMRCSEGGAASSDAGLREAGRHIAALHRVELPEFGHLKGPKYATKQDELAALVQGVTGLREADVLSEATAAAVIHASHRAAQSSTTGPRLLHGDLHARHILEKRGTVQAIIDWADAAGGDPLLDLARLSMQSEDGVLPEAFLSSYLEVHPLPSDVNSLLGPHRVVWAVHALMWEIAAEGDWIAPMVGNIEAELAKLGTR
ncbi:phosphotransferase family protein [Streptomyces sp. cmx-4-25]|uniref:phosphotransferase family protein n=1 Tax=Streptomyces sp. cmx-4-25 TaxID=2790933 RepID=UPI0039804BE4